MAHLAVVGSHSVNGVAKLHSELLKRDRSCRDFYELWPERFTNKTNGVTPRRWLLVQPRLSALITERIGPGWATDLDRLEELEPHADDPCSARDSAAHQARATRRALATLIQRELGSRWTPTSLFDVQIKRLHEYKRQLLNALHIVALYLRGKRDPASPSCRAPSSSAARPPRATAKAKLIIRFINAVGAVINRRPDVDRAQGLFLPNYRVSLAERRSSPPPTSPSRSPPPAWRPPAPAT
jgi:starch phosphorylase